MTLLLCILISVATSINTRDAPIQTESLTELTLQVTNMCRIYGWQFVIGVIEQ